MKESGGNPSARGGRVAARSALGTVVAALCAFVLFGGGSMGAFAQVAPVQTTESPTPEPSESETTEPEPEPTETTPPQPTGPSIALLNPAVEQHHGLGNPTSDEIPRISDKFDGANETYHVVATTRQAPEGAVVEAFWQPSGGGEASIGRLTKVDGASGTWELMWDVPEELSGDGTFVVKLFSGTKELAKDSEEAIIDNEEETVEIAWPTNGGQLGFFKPKVGKWRGVIEGTTSQFAQRVYVYYTKSPVGDKKVKYEICAGTSKTTSSVNPPAAAAGTNFRTWRLTCELQGKDLPSQITGVAALAAETDNPIQPGAGGLLTNESGDAHRVTGYHQEPGQMSISIAPVQPTTTSAAYPTADAQQAGNDCLEFDLTVVDQLDRPVQGANVDIHLQGPSDEVGFGDEGNTTHGSSGDKPPDGGAHEKEEAYDCDAPGDRFGEQGEHELPGRDDLKHNESALAGTGLSGPSGILPGQFRFHIFSPDAGRTKITAWVDEKPIKKESDLRAADNDQLTVGEARVSYEAQWLAGPTRVVLNPASDTFITGECSPVTVSVRGGRTPVEGANVDVHATGPTSNLDFCDPVGGNQNRPPDLGQHEPEDDEESVHPPASSNAPTTQHTEGETDDSGSFVIGLLSPEDGDTTVQAWVDGTKGADNDVRATSEPTGNGSYSWASSAGDASVHFLNPSAYGEGAGDNVSVNNDGNAFFHIVTRVDLPSLVEGVEILISSDGTSFSKLGDAARVGESDVYEFQWTARNIEEGSYTLRARIIGTDSFEDREIELDNGLNTVELARPLNNEVVAFIDQVATISGTASAGAEGVTFYYTKTAARDVNDEDAWTECGRVELETAKAPQPFAGECTLAEGDQAGSVSGIAAIADTCDPLLGCDELLSPPFHESGDAHRAFGLDSTPIVGINPSTGEGARDICQRVVIDVEDQAGGAVPNANVDVHLDGPNAKAHFCNPEGSSSNTDAPEEGDHTPVSGHPDEAAHQNSGVKHTEGQTGSNGRLVVGIISQSEGRSHLTAWVDQTDDDAQGDEESSAEATFKWVGAAKCTRSGTGGDDAIFGTPGDDRICALGGNDVINGRGGHDVIIGGAGRDLVRGNNGRDRLVGGPGNDSLVGGTGSDNLKGGGGRDVISGKGGNDTLRGGGSDDSLEGGGGRDRCIGNSGTDSFNGCERQRQ